MSASSASTALSGCRSDFWHYQIYVIGLMRLGQLIRHIPHPVTVGFTAGIAVTILAGQIKDFAGLTLNAEPGPIIVEEGPQSRRRQPLAVPEPPWSGNEAEWSGSDAKRCSGLAELARSTATPRSGSCTGRAAWPGEWRSAKINAKALAVLEALLWAFHNAKSGVCFPSYERIAEAAGCARSTVAEALKALEDSGGPSA
jgi:hypothetical protein